MKDVKDLSKFLRQSRENAGLTQMDVASRLNYSSAQFISNWERGLSSPPMKTLNVLAQMYKVGTDDLFKAILAISLHATETSLRRQYKAVVRKRG